MTSTDFKSAGLIQNPSSALAAAAAASTNSPIPSTSRQAYDNNTAAAAAVAAARELVPLTESLGIDIADRLRLQFSLASQAERNPWMVNKHQAAVAAAAAAAAGTAGSNSDLSMDGGPSTSMLTPPAAPGPSSASGYFDAGSRIASAVGGLAALAGGSLGSLSSASGLDITKLYSAEKLVGRKPVGRKPGDKGGKPRGSPASQNICYNRKFNYKA